MDPQRARELIARERARIEQAISGLAPADPDETSTLDQHQADAGAALYEDEFDAGALARLQEELAAVERAEARIDAGSYGLSVESGEPIPDERLEAVPTTERTIAEQSRFESS